MPLTSLVVQQMMARFRSFYNVKKSQDFKKVQFVSNRCKDFFKQKKMFWGYGHFKIHVSGSGNFRIKDNICWL